MKPNELVQNATRAVQESYRGGRRDAEYVAIVVIREMYDVMEEMLGAEFADEVMSYVTVKIKEKQGGTKALTIRKLISEDG